MKTFRRFFYNHQMLMITAMMAFLALLVFGFLLATSPDIRSAFAEALRCLGPYKCVRVIP